MPAADVARIHEHKRLSAAFTTIRGVLYANDCLDLLGSIKTASVDCVFADPPFNIGKDYKNGYDDRRGDGEYLAWSAKWIEESCRILKPGGSMFIYSTPELAMQFGTIMGRFVSFRHWIAMTMKGTYHRGKRLYPAHYALLYYTKGTPAVFNSLRVPIPTCRHCGGEIKDYGGHRDKLNPEGLNLTDFWADTSPNRHRRFKVRPGVNELKLMILERAILLSTHPDHIVVDPFGGGGSTFQAAEKNGRTWIGTELYDSTHVAARMQAEFPFSFSRKPAFDPDKIFINHEDNTDR